MSSTKRFFLFNIILLSFILIPCYVKGVELPKIPLDLTYYGNIRFNLSQAEVEGNKTSLITQYSLHPGFHSDYEINLNLEGLIGTFDLESTINYPIKDQSVLTFSLENPDWKIEYQPYNLKIPNLKTTFSTQNLD